MQGKLMTKSKVIQTKRTKSQVCKRRMKPERSNTPQRWSRRIRSLPPIPINVLKPRRKYKKKSTGETHTSTTFVEEARKRNFSQKGHRQKRSVFVKKNAPDKTDSVEIVRIVPVVVYVKKSPKPKTSVPDEIRVHVNDNPTCQMISEVINSHFNNKIKQEKSVVAGHSKRFKTVTRDPQGLNAVQVAKRKYRSKKKVLLYH